MMPHQNKGKQKELRKTPGDITDNTCVCSLDKNSPGRR